MEIKNNLYVGILLVHREYPQVLPKVEYYMSERGKGSRTVVKAMYEWIEKYEIK